MGECVYDLRSSNMQIAGRRLLVISWLRVKQSILLGVCQIIRPCTTILISIFEDMATTFARGQREQTVIQLRENNPLLSS